ncbi:MAG: aminotransferase class I/II-fold pyridoxal phosphate-dependent enzyme [Candidatus Competibacteraceae bacterium]
MPELRQTIGDHYQQHYGVEIPVRRILVTPGASGALQLATAVLINPGDRVLLADPGYPCNRHFVRLVEGEPVGIPVGPETAYQLTAELVARYCGMRAQRRYCWPRQPIRPARFVAGGAGRRSR